MLLQEYKDFLYILHILYRSRERNSSMLFNYAPCCVCSHWSHCLDVGLMPHILQIQGVLQTFGDSLILRYVFLDLLLMQCVAKGY
jgi:hypothetical protein